MDYFEWWKTASEKIGEENILLLPMELLREDNYCFLMRWANFFGMENDQHTLGMINRASDERKRVSSTSINLPPHKILSLYLFTSCGKWGFCH